MARGRPRLAVNVASERVSFRVTPTERQALEQYASESGLTVSETCRMELLEAIARWKADAKIEPPAVERPISSDESQRPWSPTER